MDTGLKFSLPKWRLTRWLTHSGHDTPADIRAALIASLFGTLPIFAGGVINTLMISGVVAWRRPEPLYISWLILEVVLALVRVVILRSALRAAPKGGNTHTDLYILLALFWAFSVGYGVFITFLNGDWLAATLAGVSCGAMAGGICFRNYGAPRLVGAMIFLSLGPMCLGALFTGEWVTAIVFIQIPFYLISMVIASHRLNRILVSTMLAERDSDRRASEDALTGLANRAALDRRFARALEQARRYSRPLSIVMLDIDHFKSINDEFGHQMGDRVLKEFADLLVSGLRGSDAVGRWGGEEFLLLCPETSSQQAAAFAERLCEQSRALSFSTGQTQTLSAGVAELNATDTVDSLLRRADAALYRAKHEGRDRVCCHAPDEQAS
ncbi:MAG TPA: GGDEF domain-containing protein [Achromobacter sp.]|nr:GGDEF domain-containing protein [Achromobacter sp.]